MIGRIDFLYLGEADTIAAGVNDRARCIDVCEEVFKLLEQGDYLMGGHDHNSHGECLYFPETTPFPNMPTNAPDYRFYAMPAYIGGRFDMVGMKWYGSNTENKKSGLPRSILTLVLNDKVTGQPLAFMSANLLSAARTGAIPALGAKYLAKPAATELAIIACGPINQSCAEHILTQEKSLERVTLFDINRQAAEQMAGDLQEKFDITAEVCDSAEAAVERADIITSAASRVKPLEFHSSWFKKGALLILSGQAVGDDALFTESRLVFDNLKLHQGYHEGSVHADDPEEYYGGYIAGPVYNLMDGGEIPPLTEAQSIGKIMKEHPDRDHRDDCLTLFYSVGMPIFDVAWGTEIYRNAKDKDIGQWLNLWEEPTQ